MKDPVELRKVARRLAAKLASHKTARHHPAMRRLVLVPILVLAACAPRVQAPAPVSEQVAQRPGATMLGLTANDLISRFGQPGFQVREGAGTKLQWSQNGCVLDAYLYPPESGHGSDRVTHVDSRNPSGADLTLNACLDLLRR